jgi:predicted dienelactone hydrolase
MPYALAIILLSTLSQAPCSVSLPPPTGQFNVGRTAYHFVDHASSREMMVYVWYPASSGSGKLANYIPRIEQAGNPIVESVKRTLGPAYCALQENRPLLHAIEDAPVATNQSRYPLLLFSHGAGAAALTYAAQLEDLASHGYVVAALEHPASTSGFVLFPDGRPVQVALRPPGNTPEARVQWEKDQIEGLATGFRFVIDEFTRRERPDTESHLLRGHLDFSRIGVVAHSFGGMGAVRAMQLDSRIRAGLNQDGMGGGVIAFATEAKLEKPFALMSPKKEKENSRYVEFFNALPKESVWISLDGPQFEHMSFTDLLLLRAGEDTAKRSAAIRNLELVREFTRRYFDVHLNGRPATSLMPDAKAYPEITLMPR